MHRIDTSTAQVDKFGAGKNGFTGGNPQTGELPTALDQDFFDSLQEEICNVVEGGGITLDKSDRGQMLKALKTIFPAIDLFSSQLAVPGYQKLPGGLVIQWGTGAVPISGSVTVSFPLSFSSGYVQFVSPIDQSSVNNYAVRVASSTTSTLTITSTNTQNITGFMYMALGKL